MALFIVTSCSVKESRDGSPCTLYVDSGDMCPLTVALWKGDDIIDAAASDKPKVFEFTVKRSDLLLVTAYRARTSSYYNGVLTLRDNAPVDSVYAYHKEVDCNWEMQRDTVNQCKQFATVTININIRPGHEYYPDSLRIRSLWCGVNVNNYKSVAGSYSCTFVNTGVQQSFRVLRQGDDYLKLDFLRKHLGVVTTINLGEMLDEAGYDWTEDDLKDIEVSIDAAATRLVITIKDWSTGNPIVIEI